VVVALCEIQVGLDFVCRHILITITITRTGANDKPLSVSDEGHPEEKEQRSRSV